MPLSPKTQDFFDKLARASLGKKYPTQDISIEQFRKDTINIFQKLSETHSPHGIYRQKITIPIHSADSAPIILDAKIYTPEDSEGLLPGLIFFPGGGCVLHLKQNYEVPCARIAKLSHCVVIKIETRLSPEHDHQQCLSDAYQATTYVFNHANTLGIDSNQLSLGGHSSGGNFAALIAIKVRDDIANQKYQKKTIAFQHLYLLSPRVDMTLTSGGRRKEFDPYHKVDIMLNSEVQTYFSQFYIPENMHPKNPLLSPLYANLHGLPPTTLIVGEYDGLRSETEVFYDALAQANVKVTKKVLKGTTHNRLVCGKVMDGPDPVEIVGEELATL